MLKNPHPNQVYEAIRLSYAISFWAIDQFFIAKLPFHAHERSNIKMHLRWSTPIFLKKAAVFFAEKKHKLTALV